MACSSTKDGMAAADSSIARGCVLKIRAEAAIRAATTKQAIATDAYGVSHVYVENRKLNKQ